MPFVNLDVTPDRRDRRPAHPRGDRPPLPRDPDRGAGRHPARRGGRPDRRVRARRPADDHRTGRSMPVVADPGQLLEAANRIWTRPSMESRIDDALGPRGRRADRTSWSPTPRTRRSSALVDAMIGQATDEARPTSTSSPRATACASASGSTECCTTRRRRPKNVLRPVVSRLKVMGGLRHLEQPRRPRTVASRCTVATATSTCGSRPCRRRRARRWCYDCSTRRTASSTSSALGFEADELGAVPALVPDLAGRDHRRRADGLRQDVDALRDPARAERPGSRHRERRGPDRVPPRRDQAGADRPARWRRLRRRAARDPARRPGRDPDRRGARPRDGAASPPRPRSPVTSC